MTKKLENKIIQRINNKHEIYFIGDSKKQIDNPLMNKYSKNNLYKKIIQRINDNHEIYFIGDSKKQINNPLMDKYSKNNLIL